MQKKVKSLILAGLIAIGGTGIVGCTKASDDEKVKVTLILDEGGVNDQSFNQSAWEGALEAKEQYGVEINYIEAKQESDYATNIDMAIDQDADLVIGVGFKLTDTIEEAAKTYPESKFAIIDGTYEDIPENIMPILFNEEQAGYCAGLVAANMTKTNVIGFVGGMEIPSVTNFLIGFEKAIKEENKDIKVLSQYANSFTDTAKGRIIAEQMISDKCDIIFTAGGAVNFGVFEATKEKGLYSIGVDMPSAHISPNIITSALKNVGTGVELTVKDLVEGNFKGGEAKVFDLTNGGVGYEKTDLLPKDLVEYIDNKFSGIEK
ncbi:MAG: BMP family ABC transporter substrate-binding protein [Peptostreptococcaceae bacterium]|nr:BMP family ABC transporter substrate-binding protein [Peptostreptococcaceae bacterium]